ncbi:LysR family transcriptional regulator [Phenylobacterium sp. J367]|uniref:LysR family transcriptional regulator n=1 Tax=Phenylobacterium sp. J367 TaxID=2898435 RepID=UPI002150B651|nr:LysR family transcriptional regulator [Phenylobacterium sp. J367]MCR5880065.1 LysR family transcriptional regulator [Phenylobacterium sp. J367]
MFENLTSGPLPSLNALRAFEAVARTGRVTLAAGELNVTHSAVSRQVKALEATLGVRLFSGPKSRPELTTAGRDLAGSLTEAFNQIAAAVRHVKAGGEDLHIAVNASISVKWLIPRLADFQAAHPDIRLHLSELAPHATSQHGAQAVLRMVPTSRLSDPACTPFIGNALGAVMSPDGIRRYGADPLKAPRLAAATHPEGWPVWAELAGVELPPMAERPFAHVHFAMDAALAGLGAAIVSWPLCSAEVEAGRLVAPWASASRRAPSPCWRRRAPSAAPLARFRDWLVAEGAKTPSAP